MSSTETFEHRSQFEYTPLSFDINPGRTSAQDQTGRASSEGRATSGRTFGQAGGGTTKARAFGKAGTKPGRSASRGPVPSAQSFSAERRNSGKEKKVSNINTFFLFIIITLTCVLILEVVFHFVIAPQLLINKIEVKADSGIQLSNRQILEIAGLEPETYFYSVDVESVKSNLAQYPAVRKAEVNKTFPDTLHITLHGRVPLGVAMVETENATIPAAFDSEGVIFQIGASITDWNLPVVSGVKFSEIRLGMKLPERLLTFLDKIETLKNENPVLLDVISEFRFVKKNSLDFEVMVYPRNYRVPVRIGSTIDKHLIKYMLIVLDVVERENYSDTIKELDFRTDEIVYRFKEG